MSETEGANPVAPGRLCHDRRITETASPPSPQPAFHLPRRGVRLVIPFLIMGYGLLGMVWSISTPPWASPDEPASLVKGMAAAGLDVVGRRPAFDFPPAGFDEDWYRQLTRSVHVPRNLVPRRSIPCMAFQPVEPADCLPRGNAGVWQLSREQLLAAVPSALPFPDNFELPFARLELGRLPSDATTTYLGTYQPVAFAVPGAVARLGHSPVRALRFGRLANLVWSIALLGLALHLLVVSDDPWTLPGPLLAITPMAMFTTGTFSTSGPEVAAGLCFLGALLRLGRPGPAPRLATLALIVGGLTLALARTLGPIWLAADVVIALAIGGRQLVNRLRSKRARGVAVAAGLTSAALGNLVWQLVVQPQAPVAKHQLPGFVASSLGDLPAYFREAIGVFGWLDTTLPRAVYAAWGVAIVVLLTLAWLATTRRGRLILVGVLVGTFAATLLVSAIVAYPLQARAQGRWLLPLGMAVPLVAGELLRRDRWRIGAALGDAFVRAVAVLIGLVHVIAIAAAARRYAVGTHGPLLFIGTSKWSPPAGWGPSLVAAVAASVAIVAASCLARPSWEST